MGNEYMFRVYSENLCGLSEEPRQSKNTAVIAKTGVCMLVCTVQYVCVNCAFVAYNLLHFCSDLWRLTKFACPPHFSIGLVCKENPYKEKDMACMPKFTQPLVDRSVVAGYSTAISCSVKGFPRVNMHVKVACGA